MMHHVSILDLHDSEKYSNDQSIDRNGIFTSNINCKDRGMSATSRKRLLDKKIPFVKTKQLNRIKFFFYPIRRVTSAFFQSRVHRLIRSPLLRTETTQPLT